MTLRAVSRGNLARAVAREAMWSNPSDLLKSNPMFLSHEYSGKRATVKCCLHWRNTVKVVGAGKAVKIRVPGQVALD